MGRTRILSVRALELAFVAVVGGALALGGAALLGKLGSRTTIQQVSPLGGGGVGNVTLQAPTSGRADGGADLQARRARRRADHGDERRARFTSASRWAPAS